MRKLLALIVALAAPVSSQAVVVDRVAAVVNTEVIALSEVYELGRDYIEQEATTPAGRLAAELEVLEELISRELVTQEIRRLGLDVTGDEINRAIDDIAGRNNIDRDGLRREVIASGLDWDAYREDLTQQLRQMKFNQVVLQARFSVSEDELRTVYNREVSAGEPMRRLQGVMIPLGPDATAEVVSVYRARMEATAAAFESGEFSWEELIAAFPESAYASAGGEMSAYSRGELVGALDEAVFGAVVGGLTPPIVTQGGIFLIRVAEEVAGDAPSFESLRPQIEALLMQQKMESEMELWLNQARRQSSVEVKLGE